MAPSGSGMQGSSALRARYAHARTSKRSTWTSDIRKLSPSPETRPGQSCRARHKTVRRFPSARASVKSPHSTPEAFERGKAPCTASRAARRGVVGLNKKTMIFVPNGEVAKQLQRVTRSNLSAAHGISP